MPPIVREAGRNTLLVAIKAMQACLEELAAKWKDFGFVYLYQLRRTSSKDVTKESANIFSIYLFKTRLRD